MADKNLKKSNIVKQIPKNSDIAMRKFYWYKNKETGMTEK